MFPDLPLIEFAPDVLDELTVRSGRAVEITATITGRPWPKIFWQKKNLNELPEYAEIFEIHQGKPCCTTKAKLLPESFLPTLKLH